MITPGFNLANRWVIHTVAASFLNHPSPELVLAQAIDAALKVANEQGIQSLAQAIDAALKVANEQGIQSLATPPIGTGVFRCPTELSADYTAKALAWHAGHGISVQRVRICVMTEAMKGIFRQGMVTSFGSLGPP